MVDPAQLPEDISISLVEKNPIIYSAPQGTPIIDGEIDEIWAAAEWSETSVFCNAKAPLIQSETIITDTGYLIEAIIKLQTIDDLIQISH